MNAARFLFEMERINAFSMKSQQESFWMAERDSSRP
jgi:hypothetical protein